ncbi:hypothetical protein [Sandaracinus amylolyticus]|uniref:Uncharacterized protein n=1 Tax=Sandaracinus amylolyticus TaxID=927083 RepID=A0A0F6YI54_9BACT|nr:hypothetical protein [Sandaracinus amylolyticus]AKF06610.1 hypothetical protein DB32_003759 [Sandaracinus amylolyticus]
MEDSLSTRWRAGEQARLRLAQLRVDDEGSALARAGQITQRALGVDRVSVWLVEGEGLIRCAHVVDRAALAVDAAPVIASLGAYEAAMRERRVVADVRRDV